MRKIIFSSRLLLSRLWRKLAPLGGPWLAWRGRQDLVHAHIHLPARLANRYIEPQVAFGLNTIPNSPSRLHIALATRPVRAISRMGRLVVLICGIHPVGHLPDERDRPGDVLMFKLQVDEDVSRLYTVCRARRACARSPAGSGSWKLS